jgi:hypothetical protein
MNELCALNMTDLKEALFKSKNVRVRESKVSRISFPGDLPIRSCPPTIPVHKEGEIRVVEEELAVESLDVDRSNGLFPLDEVKGGIGLVKKGLCLRSFETNNFKATSTADAEGRSQEVDR